VVDDALSPSVGLGVVHLFCHASSDIDVDALVAFKKSFERDGGQLVSALCLGHKADVAFVGLAKDMLALRKLQSVVVQCGFCLSWSYVSLTELSEYAGGVPEEMQKARLYPQLPPDDMRAFCFYPMSKRRSTVENWYSLSFDERLSLMGGHGKLGRTFRGRVLQLITGSTGLDDYEWGVTLFGVHPDDLKDCVYQMRFDEASARFGEFGPFIYGTVIDVATIPKELGLS
jgi:chlorite dismutase